MIESVAIVLLIAVGIAVIVRYNKFTKENPPKCSICGVRDNMAYLDTAHTWICTDLTCSGIMGVEEAIKKLS